MSKYDFALQLLEQVPNIMNTYFGMVTSGNQNAAIAGVLGLIGLGYVAFKLVRRFWVRLAFFNI